MAKPPFVKSEISEKPVNCKQVNPAKRVGTVIVLMTEIILIASHVVDENAWKARKFRQLN